jgi:hypothetical protein
VAGDFLVVRARRPHNRLNFPHNFPQVESLQEAEFLDLENRMVAHENVRVNRRA